MKHLPYIILHSAAMEQFGAALAHACNNQAAVIFLHGDLGAGKTTLVRGFLHAIGHIGAVKSPTFSLVESYDLAGQAVFHFDLYRLNAPDELAPIGWHDYFNGENTCLIEWPEKAGNHLPRADIEISFQITDQSRAIELKAGSAIGETILKRLEYKDD